MVAFLIGGKVSSLSFMILIIQNLVISIWVCSFTSPQIRNNYLVFHEAVISE